MLKLNKHNQSRHRFYKSLNTSHVKVKLNIFSDIKNSDLGLNTSHVKVKPKTACLIFLDV